MAAYAHTSSIVGQRWPGALSSSPQPFMHFNDPCQGPGACHQGRRVVHALEVNTTSDLDGRSGSAVLLGEREPRDRIFGKNKRAFRACRATRRVGCPERGVHWANQPWLCRGCSRHAWTPNAHRTASFAQAPSLPPLPRSLRRRHAFRSSSQKPCCVRPSSWAPTSRCCSARRPRTSAASSHTASAARAARHSTRTTCTWATRACACALMCASCRAHASGACGPARRAARCSEAGLGLVAEGLGLRAGEGSRAGGTRQSPCAPWLARGRPHAPLLAGAAAN